MSSSNNSTTTHLFSDVVQRSSTNQSDQPQPASATPTTPALATPVARIFQNRRPPARYNDFVRSDNLEDTKDWRESNLVM